MNIKNTLLSIVCYLSVWATCFAAEPTCWVNIYSEVGCPKNYSYVFDYGGRVYTVFCYRLHTHGYQIAYQAPEGYSKRMYCEEAVMPVTQECRYSCLWTEIGGNSRFRTYDYRLFYVNKVIEQVYSPCEECSDL